MDLTGTKRRRMLILPTNVTIKIKTLRKRVKVKMKIYTSSTA